MTLVAVFALILGTAAPVSAASASVAALTPGGPVKTSLAGFQPGNMISDAVFTDKTTMTEAQIQTFFASKVKTCRGGSDKWGPIVCLKDYKTNSVDRPADAYCTGYKGAKGESAARIIYRVAQACNINPRVLIVMLEKEQSLVTHTWPSAWRYDKALGQGCPDDAACNPAYVGFFYQIYGAARQMQVYMEGRYFTWYAPGKTWNILYNPNRACGSAPVYVANKATAALYYYTPYQPNAAALRAGYGSGDSCSSYGNRNFYNLFTDWFGPTLTSSFVASPPALSGYVRPGQQITAVPRFTPSATTVTYQWYLDGKPLAGQTKSGYDIVASDVGRELYVKVTGARTGYASVTAESAHYTVRSVSVDRAAGADRERTAVAASRLAWPSGAKVAYIATANEFADALSAAPATARAGGSLLLSSPSRLSDAVADELRRLNPTRVVLLGGPGVLSDQLLNQIKKVVPSAKPTRVYGADRYATSRAVAEASGASESAFVATGLDFPDALSAAAAGSAARQPVLLVPGDAAAVDAATRATITKLGVKKVTIVGGTGVVSAGLETSLRAAGLTVTRLSGADRYDTNLAVNRAYFPASALRSLIAAGEDFPDALSASALAGRMSVPMLLAERACVRVEAGDFLRQRNTSKVTLVGGTSVLTPDGVEQLRLCR